MSQWLAEQHARNEMPAKWYYEISDANPLRAGEQPSTELPSDKLFEYGINTWKRCVVHVQSQSGVVILDAGLFQHVTMQAFRSGCPQSAINSYLMQVEDIILPVQPLIVYLSPGDVAQHVEQIYRARGEGFQKRIVRWSGESANAKQKGYLGHGGSLRFWHDFHGLCNGFSQRTRVNLLRFDLNVVKPNWPEHQHRLLQYLQIKPIELAQSVSPNRFVGAYFHKETGRETSIFWKSGQLYAAGILEPLEQESVLLPSKSNRFVVRGHDAELEFSGKKIFVSSGWRRIDGSVFIKRGCK